MLENRKRSMTVLSRKGVMHVDEWQYQNFGGDKSFVDDLITERGAVSSRVALLLRSAEAKPLFSRFVFPLWDEVEGREEKYR